MTPENCYSVLNSRWRESIDQGKNPIAIVLNDKQFKIFTKVKDSNLKDLEDIRNLIKARYMNMDVLIRKNIKHIWFVYANA